MSIKNLILLLFITIKVLPISAQTLIRYDYIENYNWFGGWSVGYGNNTGYYTNAFVSSTSSAALIGAGNGTSNIEDGLYVLPNVTGLVSAYEYEFRFRLGSYKFNSPSSTSAGVDATDYVLLYISYNNATLIQEIRINGYNNALWNYNTTLIQKTASGTLTTYSAQNGSYSDIRLKFTNTTQFTVRVYVRVNSAGEEWWLDNFELWQITTPLPVSLISFEGDRDSLWWEIYSEYNNDYYTILYSKDGYNFEPKYNVPSEGKHKYSTKNTVGGGYFILRQTDYDGKFEDLDVIYVTEYKKRMIIKITNLMGQEVLNMKEGEIYLLIYDDGFIEKIVK
jgi:hypothetical protein